MAECHSSSIGSWSTLFLSLSLIARLRAANSGRLIGLPTRTIRVSNEPLSRGTVIPVGPANLDVGVGVTPLEQRSPMGPAVSLGPSPAMPEPEVDVGEVPMPTPRDDIDVPNLHDHANDECEQPLSALNFRELLDSNLKNVNFDEALPQACYNCSCTIHPRESSIGGGLDLCADCIEKQNSCYKEASLRSSSA